MVSVQEFFNDSRLLFARLTELLIGMNAAGMAAVLAFFMFLSLSSGKLVAGTLPDNFQAITVASDLHDPSGFAFSPDGKMFITERISGKLLIAQENSADENWVVRSAPFYTFLTPRTASGVPQRHRSAGLRDLAFDPDYLNNGYIYAFYMHADTLQNRVVRIRVDPARPLFADSEFGEELLLELPFNDNIASGSHNGGGLEFGADGSLYISTGDGWTGEFAGDPVQSLSSFTGKILRINKDGSIPTDNPFYQQTNGDYRAIFATGLRNPFTLSKNPVSGALYINEARGTKKADIYRVERGANYGHQAQGTSSVRRPWANGSGAGSQLITGGAWYPTSGPYPAQYHGAYFLSLWGGNAEDRGQISYIKSETDSTVAVFEADSGDTFADSDPLKPVVVRVGPDSNIYYMLSTYETSRGAIQKLKYTGQLTVAEPQIAPGRITSEMPVTVEISSATGSSQIYYTEDNSTPTIGDAVYTKPITVTRTTTVKARAFRSGYNPSSVATAVITIAEPASNIPPVASAGADKVVTVGTTVVLDGSASTDPDGDDAFLTEEQWTQVSGPAALIVEAEEEVAYFTPSTAGTYVFQLSLSDTIDTATDRVVITAENVNSRPVDPPVVSTAPVVSTPVVVNPPAGDTLVAPALESTDGEALVRLALDAGSGDAALNSGFGTDGRLVGGAAYDSDTADNSAYSVRFDGVNDYIDLGSIDVFGNGLTLAARFKADTFTGDVKDGRLISKATGVATKDHIFMLSTIASDNEVRLRARVRAGGVTKTLVAKNGNLSTGKWYHAAVTHDETTLRLYLDGELVGSTPLIGAVDRAPGVSVAVAGQPAGAGLRYFDGVLDEVGLWQRPLATNEIKSLAAR